ncbi:MAG: sugar phosphate isomerase/epimerase [Clostridia bacterium]
MKTLPVAVQVYSVRDIAEKDFKGTLEKLKAIGYTGVELAGLYGLKPSYIKEVLTELDLIPVSAHVPFNELVDDLEGTVAAYKEIGVSYMAIPYLGDDDRPGAVNFEENLKKMVTIGECIKANGMTMLYHNHDFEFIKMPNGEYGLDYIYSTISPEILQTEIDTCWVKVSGENPAEYVKKYSGRAPVVHLKDFIKEGQVANMYELIGLESEKKEETGKFEFRPVGYGCQDFKPILEASVEAGASWVVVEQDQAYERTTIEAVTLSREYLKTLGW